tara:strand:- start:585 stop:944 length:360 start_codon:yes stop_codon:yes gene_type:complete
MLENENRTVHQLSPEELAQGQLEAYNNHDIETFCTFFSEDILVFDALTKQILFEGMEDFRERYTQSFANPNLHCTLVNRMVHENIVIDQESVVGLAEEVVQAIAIYHIKDNRITEVHFY